MLAWIRTKLDVLFVGWVMPLLQSVLVWYLKFSGQRNVEKHWRKQLPTLSAQPSQPKKGESPTRTSTSNITFTLQVATVRDHGSRIEEISAMVNGAYVRELRDALLTDSGAAEAAFSRTSPTDIQQRLLTDGELAKLRCSTSPAIINRVLFLAITPEDAIIGTCAATLSAPWCPLGVGSWGCLASSSPGGGVGSALVSHCEEYIKLAMLDRVRIEYFYISGLPTSDALRKWYENRLGYTCFSHNSTGKSYRGNEVRGEVSFRHCEKAVELQPISQVEIDSGHDAICLARKKRMANFLLGNK